MLEPKRMSFFDACRDEGFGIGFMEGYVGSEIEFIDLLTKGRKRLEAKKCLTEEEAKSLDAIRSCMEEHFKELPYRREEAEIIERLQVGRAKTEEEIATAILRTTEYYMGPLIWKNTDRG